MSANMEPMTETNSGNAGTKPLQQETASQPEVTPSYDSSGNESIKEDTAADTEERDGQEPHQFMGGQGPSPIPDGQSSSNSFKWNIAAETEQEGHQFMGGQSPSPSSGRQSLSHFTERDTAAAPTEREPDQFMGGQGPSQSLGRQSSSNSFKWNIAAETEQEGSFGEQEPSPSLARQILPDFTVGNTAAETEQENGILERCLGYSPSIMTFLTLIVFVVHCFLQLLPTKVDENVMYGFGGLSIFLSLFALFCQFLEC